MVESHRALAGTTLAVSCPRCGGVPDPEGGPGHLARCRQCGVLGRLHDSESRQRLVARRLLELDAALAALVDSFGPSSGRAPQLMSSELLYVPLWRTEAIVVGRMRGQRARIERDVERMIDDEGVAYYAARRESGPPREIDQEVQRRHTIFVSACPLTELGLPLLDRHRQQPGALGLKPAHDGRVALDLFAPGLRDDATVLDPLVTEDEGRAEATLVVQALSAGVTSSLLPGAEAHTEILHCETTLLYWPVWHLRFACDGRRGDALIDAVGGGVVSMRLAATKTRQLLAKRLFGLIALSLGLFCGGVMHVSVAPPPWLAGNEAGSMRLRLLCVGAGAAFASWRLLKYLVRQHLGPSP